MCAHYLGTICRGVKNARAHRMLAIGEGTRRVVLLADESLVRLYIYKGQPMLRRVWPHKRVGANVPIVMQAGAVAGRQSHRLHLVPSATTTLLTIVKQSCFGGMPAQSRETIGTADVGTTSVEFCDVSTAFRTSPHLKGLCRPPRFDCVTKVASVSDGVVVIANGSDFSEFWRVDLLARSRETVRAVKGHVPDTALSLIAAYVQDGADMVVKQEDVAVGRVAAETDEQRGVRIATQVKKEFLQRRSDLTAKEKTVRRHGFLMASYAEDVADLASRLAAARSRLAEEEAKEEKMQQLKRDAEKEKKEIGRAVARRKRALEREATGQGPAKRRRTG